MKKIIKICFFTMLLFTLNVNALKSTDANLTGRKVCEKIELAKANSDGTIEKVDCFSNYNDAKARMNESDDKSLIILERNNSITKIIDAKYALVYLDRGDVLTYLYSSNSLKTSITYMNNYANYGATDGAFIELNYSNKAAKIRIGGATGWVKNGEYTIIPINFVKSYSYYKIDSNNIYHFYAKNIENSGYSQSSRALGPKPSFEIENGNYISYDGIYFYKDFYTMINDYRANTHNESINKDNAYYNYYLYLPHRSKTNYAIDDFDSYIRNVLNFKGSLYGKFLTDNYSVIYGTAEYFMYAEKMYGANALSVFSLSRNESANGRSFISYNKNNIFGHNAVDGAAYSSATGYLDVRSSIYSHGYGYINYGYAKVSDSRYNGSHFGNKNTGMNVMYASDVYWGEKAASYYYSFDKANGMEDYNYYQLIVSNTTNINVRSAPSTSSSVVYQIKKSNTPFILIQEVEGTAVNGNNIWYKIQSDSNVTNAGVLIGSNSSTWPQYNWNGYVYVHSSYFNKINDAKKEDNSYNIPVDVIKEINEYTITTNASKSAYAPIVGKVGCDIDYYYTSTLLNKKGTIKKDSLVVILEKAEIGEVTNYLIITNYSTNQKAWISSENIEIVNKDLVSVNIAEANGYISVLDKPGGTGVLNVYNGNFLPIIGKEEKDNKLYLKVEYKIEGSILYGYILSSISNINYTLNYINTLPIIEAEDKTVIINSEFDPLSDIKCTDREDGDLKNKVIIVENTVNTKVIGDYKIVYSVTDSYGDTVTKEIKVSVVNLEEKDELFMYNSLKHLNDDIFEFSGFMGIKGMDNKDVKTNLIFINQNTGIEYSFDLSKWEDYPYEMSSIDDKKEYDYSGGWFKNNLDLSTLPNGDYTIYVHTINGKNEAFSIFTNIAYMDMTRRAKGKNKEFLIEVDYSSLNSPLIFSVRDTLISLDVPKTLDPMYNFFNEISLNNDSLTLKGTSHSIGVNFGILDQVERKIIFEEKNTFKRYEFDLGSIIDGDYPITLAVSDNCDKTKAWYLNTINLSTLPNGQYVIYIKNKVNNIAYYGELIDIAYTDFSKINNQKYLLNRNDNIRLRLELTVNK